MTDVEHVRWAIISVAALPSFIALPAAAQDQVPPLRLDSVVAPPRTDGTPIERNDLVAWSSLALDFQSVISDDSADPVSKATLGQAGPGIDAALEAGDWRVNLILYVWLPIRMNGTSSVAGATVPIDFSIGDVFDSFKPIGLAGRVEAWHDDTFGLILDGNYVRLESKGFSLPTMPLPTPFDLTIQQGIIDLAGGWRVFKHPLTEAGPESRIWVDLIGGVRWQYLDQTIDISGGPSLGGSENWLEPLVGARFVWQINEAWALMFRGDASGFGVGSASNLTWNLVAGAAWSPTDRFTLQFAYRFQSIDYDNGSQGPDQIGLDLDLHGPYLGFAFVF